MNHQQMTLDEFATRGMKAQAAVDKLCNQPYAHTADPQTSFDAGQKMVESGELNRQQKEVHRAISVYTHTTFTAKELSHRSGLNYWQIQRRLNELMNKYLISRVINKEATKKHKKIIYKQREKCCVWKLT